MLHTYLIYICECVYFCKSNFMARLNYWKKDGKYFEYLFYECSSLIHISEIVKIPNLNT